MGGYQRFRIGNGPRPKYVWAKSLREAQQRWRDSEVRAADPWDIYLVGHGYSLQHYAPPDQYAPHPPRLLLEVPEGITVLFYCSPGGFFDDHIESSVVGRHGAAPLAEEPIVVRPRDPEPVSEHILVFPSMRTGFHLEEMVQILKGAFFSNLNTRDANPDFAPLRLNAALRNHCALYVGNPKIQGQDTPSVRRNRYRGNYAYLSDILKLVARQHTPTKVHWLACRADYPGASTNFYAQATGTFGRFGDYDNLSEYDEEAITSALAA